jgi:hypothetical protein
MSTVEPPFRSKSPEPIAGPAVTDPTFDLRRKQANLCEAVMFRVFDLEAQAAALTETAKKLRAAVLANT